MRRVIIESPYTGPTPEAIEDNRIYARACVRDCLQRGESPIASHLLLTQPGILRDEVPEERAMGISAGLCWQEAAHAAVVYMDRGLSDGMRRGIDMARQMGLPVEFRTLRDGA